MPDSWGIQEALKRLSTVISGQGHPTLTSMYSVKGCVVTLMREKNRKEKKNYFDYLD